MPLFCGIDIRLMSQPENITLPEYISSSILDTNATGNSDYPIIKALISVTNMSHFWIVYSIPSPCPLSGYYFFRMTLADNIVLNWGCGAKDGYQGKVMFALVNDGNCSMETNSMEKRIFSIVDCDGNLSIPETEIMMIAVYRAQGRKRISRKFSDYQDTNQTLNDVANIRLIRNRYSTNKTLLIPSKAYESW